MMESDLSLQEDHAELVATLEKAPDAIIASLSPDMVSVWHMATGVATEAGELLDAAKKFAIYNRDLDRENLVEELGDLEFYMQGIRARCGITREETLAHNLRKLRIRYGAQYSDVAAIARADKA